MSHRFSRGRIALAALIVCALTASHAPATVQYDLRFRDGTKSKWAYGPSQFQVDVFARIGGIDSINNEALQQSVFSLYTFQTQTTLAFSGAITGVTSLAPFNASGSRAGAAANITNDLFLDWGGSFGDPITDPDFAVASSGAAPIFSGGVTGASDGFNGWEFPIATFTISVSAIQNYGQTARFNIARPLAPGNFGTITTLSPHTTYYADNVGPIIADDWQKGIGASSVSLFAAVPEPSAGLVLIPMLCAALRRQRDRP